jgi:hypothetical protein
MWHARKHKEEERHAYRVLTRIAEGLRPLAKAVVDGRIILKWILQKIGGSFATGSVWLRMWQVVCSCEHGDELLQCSNQTHIRYLYTHFIVPNLSHMFRHIIHHPQGETSVFLPKDFYKVVP